MWQKGCKRLLPDGSRMVDVHFVPGNGPVELKVSEWDDLPGNLMAQNSYLRCCWRGRKQPLVVQELHLADLLGVVFNREKAQLRLVHCPRGRAGSRVRDDVLLQISGGPEVLKDAESWARDISSKCYKAGPMGAVRKFHVFINPASGSGQAQVKWREAHELFKCLPWFSIQEVMTTRAGEACEVAAQLQRDSCDGIIVVSGDGMVHEVFNGLAGRPDAADALQIPVGHIPGGSGNAFAKSILHSAGESYGVLDAAFLIAKGRTQNLDLMMVSQPSQAKRTSFLSLTGAIIADIDLGSEFLRFLGGLRFPVYTVYCLLKPTLLEAEISYWPATASTSPDPASVPALDAPLPEGPWVTMRDSFSVFWATNMAWTSYDVHLSPGHSMGSQTWHLAILRNVGRGPLLKFLTGLETGSHVNMNQTEIIECKAFRVVPISSSGGSSRERFAIDGEEIPFEPIQLWPTFGGHVLGAPHEEEVGGVMASL